MPAPTMPEVRTYLGSNSSYTDDEITAALESEKAAQASVCRVPLDEEPWPFDLKEALKRRVSHNLAMKALPLGLQASMSEMSVAVTRVGSDPEVRRLEGPWRKRVVG